LKEDVYAAYLGFFEDLQNAATGQYEELQLKKLNFVNQINHSIMKKDVPFKNGVVSYAWTGLPINGGSDVTVNGHTYHMVPSNPTQQSKNNAYGYASSLLSNYCDKPELKIVGATPTGPLSRDASAFARKSDFHGNVYSTVENETYFDCQLLGTFSRFDQTANRSSNYIRPASTNSCLAMSIPLISGFTMKNYKSKFPIRPKFIDIGEFIYAICAWYVELASKAVQVGGGNQNWTLNMSYEAFRIMVRQQLVWAFNAEQAITQTCLPLNTSNTCRALLLGQNCYAKKPTVEMILSNVLTENIRLLLAKMYAYETKFANVRKNVIVNVPCLVTYDEATWAPFFYVDSNGASQPMFTDMTTNDISLVDGWGNSSYIDLNDPSIGLNVAEFNNAVTALAAGSAGNMTIGGSSPSTLLDYTRYYNDISNTEISARHYELIPDKLKHMIRKEKIEVKLEKTNSKSKDLYQGGEKVKEYKYFLAPGANSATFSPFAITSNKVISPDAQTYLDRFILPSYVIEPNQATGVSLEQIQTEYGEPHQYKINTTPTVPTQLFNLYNSGQMSAPGVAAAKVDVLSATIAKREEEGDGGFISDILGVATYASKQFGF